MGVQSTYCEPTYMYIYTIVMVIVYNTSVLTQEVTIHVSIGMLGVWSGSRVRRSSYYAIPSQQTINSDLTYYNVHNV